MSYWKILILNVNLSGWGKCWHEIKRLTCHPRINTVLESDCLHAAIASGLGEQSHHHVNCGQFANWIAICRCICLGFVYELTRTSANLVGQTENWSCKSCTVDFVILGSARQVNRVTTAKASGCQHVLSGGKQHWKAILGWPKYHVGGIEQGSSLLYKLVIDTYRILRRLRWGTPPRTRVIIQIWCLPQWVLVPSFRVSSHFTHSITSQVLVPPLRKPVATDYLWLYIEKILAIHALYNESQHVGIMADSNEKGTAIQVESNKMPQVCL